MTELSDPLEEQIRDARRTIKSEGYPMSIGELTNLYREGELVIRPEFQRFFRWSATQKSNLVESILLRIPIPSIFVAQSESGSWELIDGLQRVSTILELQGELKGKSESILPSLRLLGTKYLPDLEGRQWSHENPARSLSEAQRLDIKRSKIDIKIIEREFSPQTKYDLFQRLNSYGSRLTAQELRSALLVAVSPPFLTWIERLAGFNNFQETTMLSDRLIDERYDLELVLRFLVLHSWPQVRLNLSSLRDFSQVLDEESVRLAISYPAGDEKLESVFADTFNFLCTHGGENVFHRWDRDDQRFKGSFLNTAFEVFGLGTGFHFSEGSHPRNDVLEAARQFWSSDEMEMGYATGKSTEARMVRFIPLGRELMRR